MLVDMHYVLNLDAYLFSHSFAIPFITFSLLLVHLFETLLCTVSIILPLSIVYFLLQKLQVSKLFSFAEIHGRHRKGMACADCLRRDFTSVSVCYLAANDSAFCYCNALDNGGFI